MGDHDELHFGQQFIARVQAQQENGTVSHFLFASASPRKVSQPPTTLTKKPL